MARPADPLFSVRELVVRYGAVPALRGLDFQVAPGERIGLLGPNGAGKTTLLRCLCRLLDPTSGSIEFLGQALQKWERRAFARRVAYLPQQVRLLFPYSAWEVVSMGRFPHQAGVFFESPEDRQSIREALELTGTLPLAARQFPELSGGEQQLVCLAAALAQHPDVLLLDEPTVFLDLRHQLQVFEILNRLHQARRVTLILVTHDLNLARSCCDRLLLLKEGRLAAELAGPNRGIPAEMLEAVFDVSTAQIRMFPGVVDRDGADG